MDTQKKIYIYLLSQKMGWADSWVEGGLRWMSILKQ